MSIQLTKSELRNIYREKRSEIPVAESVAAAQKAALHFISHPLFEHKQRIACYLAFSKELDTMPLIRALWKAGKQCYLPVLTEGGALDFMQYRENDKLVANLFGIPEPIDSPYKIAAEQLDLVLTPLVAFDQTGARLGTGGGYYDRTFAFLQANPTSKPMMFGFAYALQEASSIPADPWDIFLDGIITEQGIILFNDLS